ncbi:MAG: fibronectin type III domain-containing protein [Thaumarchaeota archaeon]|nr:fibronectin type III domain-containing protein [Nitrososphaerota archaeon]
MLSNVHNNHSLIVKRFNLRLLLGFVILAAIIIFLTGQVFAQTLPTKPDRPTDLSAMAVSPTTINLLWSAPANNGGSPITGYKIEVKIIPADYTTLVSNTGNTTTKYTHSNVITGKNYVYRVSAINAIGTSDPSGEAIASPTSTSAPPANIPPNPPTGLTATAISPTMIKLVWTEPTSNGGWPTTSYKVERKVGTGTYSILAANTGNKTTTYYDAGLTTGTAYTYKVSAINSIGAGSTSNEATATPTPASAPPATIPGFPTGLTAAAASTTQVSLSWGSPSSNGGAPITGYKIEAKNGTSIYSVLTANAGNVTSYMHSGLKTGTTYTYRVSAINSVGPSTPSNEASATPAKTTTPTGLTAIAVSPTQISLSWFAPTETYTQTISGYKVERKLNSNTFITIVDSTGTRATTYSVSGLETGKTYTFVVSACFTGACSNPSNEASATPTPTSAPPPGQTSSPPPNQSTNSPPGPPTGLAAIAGSPPKVSLSWSAPSSNGGSAITGYKIEMKSGNATYSVLVTNTGTTTTSYSHTGLEAGKTYTYRVSAINSIGAGNPSNEATATPAVAEVPPAPTQTPSAPSSGRISVENTEFSIRYDVSGAKILSMQADQLTNSLSIKMESTSSGVLTVPLPRTLIDAKKAQGDDDVFYVLADKNETKFTETKKTISRTLEISFPSGTKEITIYGTHVIPEFGAVASLVLVAGIAFLIFAATMTRRLQFFSY